MVYRKNWVALGNYPGRSGNAVCRKAILRSALLHEFASSFWKAGEHITFQVDHQSFTRRKADGTIATVTRKGYTRRSTRRDAWRYHLRELALAEEPLRYMRRYLRVEEDLDPDADGEQPSPTVATDKAPALPAKSKPTAPGITLVRNRLS